MLKVTHEDSLNYKHSINNFEFIVHEHPSCIKLLNFIKKQLRTNHNDALTPNKSIKESLQVLVFSIVQDNRIPTYIEDWIENKALNENSFICLLGDFDFENNDFGQNIILETIKQLKMKIKNTQFNFICIDTPIRDYLDTAEKVISSMLDFSQYNSKPPHSIYKSISKIKKKCISENHPIFANRYWIKLVSLLKAKPYIELLHESSNKEIFIELTDRQDYPRSLIEGHNQIMLREIWLCIEKIPYLVDFRIPYAGINQWPNVSTPRLYSSLLRLDLRCNNIKNYKFLKKFKNLKKLNLAANNLYALPKEIFCLKSLKIIFAYKNSISTIDPKISTLINLRKLSMYRNLLESIPMEISHCLQLQYINLGANPIKNLPESIKQMKNLDYLSLRNCKLKKIPRFLDEIKCLNLNIEKNFLEY